MSKTVVLTMLICCMGLIPHQVAGAESPTLDAVLEQLSRHQQRLTNLKVVAEFSERPIADNRATISGTVTAWIIPVPGSKIRYDIDCHERGREPYRMTNSYNGRARYDFLQEKGVHPVGVLKRERLAYVDAPKFGWNASLYGCFDVWGKTLTQFVDENRKRAGTEIKIDQQNEGGKQYIVLTIVRSNVNKLYAFWLDPDRAYALKRLVQYDPKPGQAESVIADIKELKEVAPSAYYPSHVVWTVHGTLMEYRANSIVANDPAFDDAVFTFQWPVDTVVSDELTDIAIVIGERPESMDKLLQAEANRVEQLRKTPPVAPATSSATAASHPMQQKPSGGSVWPYWLGGVLIFVTLAVLAAFTVRRRNRPSLLILMAVIILPLKEASAQMPSYSPLIEELGSQKVFNCGVTTSGFVLAHFGIGVDTSKIADQLDVGRNWERPASLLKIRQVLAQAGLTVEGFKDATLAEATAKLGSDTIVVLHTRIGQGNGRFMVLAASSADSALIVDAGHGARWVSGQERDAIDRGFSGLFLVVSGHPAIKIGENKTIEIGSVPPQGELRVRVRVRNPGEEPLALQDAKGSCSCLRSAHFIEAERDVIDAGRSQLLELVFDGSRQPGDAYMQKVMLSFGGAKRVITNMEIVGKVQGSQDPAGISWFPERIDYGVSDHFTEQAFTLTVPKTVEVKGISTSGNVECFLLRQADDDQRSVKVLQYRIVVKPEAPRELREHVAVTLSDEHTPLVRVPIVGRCRSSSMHNN